MCSHRPLPRISTKDPPGLHLVAPHPHSSLDLGGDCAATVRSFCNFASAARRPSLFVTSHSQGNAAFKAGRPSSVSLAPQGPRQPLSRPPARCSHSTRRMQLLCQLPKRSKHLCTIWMAHAIGKKGGRRDSNWTSVCRSSRARGRQPWRVELEIAKKTWQPTSLVAK